MPLFRTILFAADFSERSKEAFRVACSLAHETKTRLFVLHVGEQTQVAGQAVAFGEFGVSVLHEVERNPSHEALSERLRELYTPPHSVDVEYLIKDGVAADEILRAADEVGADLIVLGTHGRTGLRRLLVGSVAEAVLRRARCPVLALRSADLGARTVQGVRAILHPTDLSARSEDALRVARALARDLGARLVLLLVVPSEVIVTGEIPMPVDLQACRDSLEALRRQADGPDLKWPVEVQLRQGEVVVEILDTAKALGCDLIVMGTHGRTGLGRLLMGSVAESVLRGADCPVLAVKTPLPTAA
jgi:nucleotide-binding universal stress UspA family protein